MGGYKYLTMFILLALAFSLIFSKQTPFDWKTFLLILAIGDYVIYNEHRLKTLEQKAEKDQLKNGSKSLIQ